MSAFIVANQGAHWVLHMSATAGIGAIHFGAYLHKRTLDLQACRRILCIQWLKQKKTIISTLYACGI